MFKIICKIIYAKLYAQFAKYMKIFKTNCIICKNCKICKYRNENLIYKTFTPYFADVFWMTVPEFMLVARVRTASRSVSWPTIGFKAGTWLIRFNSTSILDRVKNCWGLRPMDEKTTDHNYQDNKPCHSLFWSRGPGRFWIE